MRHGKTRGVFFSDKYKRQRGSVKLSLPCSSVYTFLQYSCQNLRRSNQRKAQSKQKGAVQQIERHMVRTQLLIRMRKLYKRFPFRRAINSRIVPRNSAVMLCQLSISILEMHQIKELRKLCIASMNITDHIMYKTFVNPIFYQIPFGKQGNCETAFFRELWQIQPFQIYSPIL